MLAGIVICVFVLAFLAFGLPWLAAHKMDADVLDGDPTQRFSDSVRILHRDLADMTEDTSAEVSTPLTRRAELTEIRLLARGAAMRRRRMVSGLLLINIVTIILAAFSVIPWWGIGIALLGLVAFVVAARISTTMMRQRFDERAAAVRAGYEDVETTSLISAAKPEASSEFSVDLSAPEASGPLWEPIPVVAPTYVSKPLVPRTVRTIDLSAPVSDTGIIPTADRPDGQSGVAHPRPVPVRRLPRAVGE